MSEPEGKVCDVCDGTGRVWEDDCETCSNYGWVDDPSDGGTKTCPDCDGESGVKDLVAYYRKGGTCYEVGDECRDRKTGCPCTDTANEIERLRAANKRLTEAKEVLS